jgi:diaminohydroxyphosphoribosylaminopyrimidine deaminase/5-amino-6-(5-phosphoribosylamino)uracil reductase
MVYGCIDCNPAHAGRADVELAAAGIEVRSGVLADECAEILRPFFKVQRTGLPWVIWKTAMSVDGRITRPPGEGQWLTSEAARADVQRLRAAVDAILTSGETVRRDRPALTIRVPELREGRQQPWRVVVTHREESLPRDAAIFGDEWADRTLVRARNDLTDVMRGLVADQGVLSVMIEAGGELSAAMFEENLVDEVVVYLAPLVCGGVVPALGGAGFPEAVRLREIAFERIGDDVRLRAVVVPRAFR